MRYRLLINPDQNLLELLNRAVFVVSIQILELWHVLIFLYEFKHQSKYFREFFIVSFDYFNRRERVFPVGPDMLGAARKLVVLEAIVLVDGHCITSLNEPDIPSHVHLLRPALHVKTDVHHALLLGLWVFVSHHER